MGSGREMYAGSGARALPARATSSGSSVSGSKRTIAVGRSGAPAIAATEPGATTMLSNSVNGEATSPTRWSWRIWSSRSRPSLRATATMLPSARNAYDERPNTHAGSANSASVGASASSRGPSARRYRFHQPLRSLAKWSSPSADHSGWAIDSSTPPAASSGVPSDPSAATVATRSRVVSHGMSGWSHSSQASRSPAGDRRGAATKSGPLTRTVGGASPSRGTATSSFRGWPSPE